MKFLNDNKVFYGFILFIFISINVLLFFIGNSENKNDKLYLKYVVEQTISDIMDSFRETNSFENLKMNRNLIGFGIYNIDGINILSYGKTPITILIDDALIKDDFIEIDNYKKTIVLIRPIGMMRAYSNHPNQRHYGRPKSRNIRFIYIKMDLKSNINSKTPLIMRLSTISAITLIIMIFFILLYKKSEKYKSQLEKQNNLAQLGEASRTIAHEIKNPLSAIMLQTGFLKKVIPSEYQNEISIIEEETERIKNISDRVRFFLKDPVGKPEIIDIMPFIGNIVSKYKHNITVENLFTDENIQVKIDPENLRSILENVINNALESYEDKDEKIVEIEVKKYKNDIYVYIKDRGKGLENENSDKIYHPFYTTKIHGSGIGLALTKKFIEAVSGKITISPREDGGTKVEIMFKNGDK